METAAHQAVHTPRGSIVDAVANVYARFAQLQADLQAAHREIAELRRSQVQGRTMPLPLPDPDLASLRRHVAVYCHPDRSGNGELMCRLNVLFDYLENAQNRQLAAR